MSKLSQKLKRLEEIPLKFEPKIIGFLCNWCSYAGADLAGVSRIQYPPNIRIIRVMCSGRIEPYFIFDALKNGIDGIMMMGCHPGECHYISGNYEAEMKYILVKQLLEYVNLADRVHLEWVSASEGIRFGKVVSEFTEFIRQLGPSPFTQPEPDPELILNLNALQRAADDYRLRAFTGRKRKLLQDGNVYSEEVSASELKKFEKNAIFDEYQRNRLLLHLKQGQLSVKDLASKLNIDSSKILKYIVDLRAKGMIDLAQVQNLTPYYISIYED